MNKIIIKIRLFFIKLLVSTDITVLMNVGISKEKGIHPINNVFWIRNVSVSGLDRGVTI